MSISPYKLGVLGIQRGRQGMDKAAAAIAYSEVASNDLVEALVDLKSQSILVSASVKVAKTSDENVGTILNLVA